MAKKKNDGNDGKKGFSGDLRRIGEKLIDTPTFNRMLKENISTAKILSVDHPSKDVAPRMLLMMDKQSVPPGAVPDDKFPVAMIGFTSMPEGVDKQDMMFAIGQEAAQKGIRLVCAFFISEAWMKPADVGKSDEESKKEMQKLLKKYGGKVSEMPGRVEALIVCGRTLDGRANFATIKIERNDDKEIVLGEENVQECGAAGSQVQDNLLGAFFAGYMMQTSKLLLASELLGIPMPENFMATQGGCACGGECEEGEEWKKGKSCDCESDCGDKCKCKGDNKKAERPLSATEILEGLPTTDRESPFDGSVPPKSGQK